MTSKKCFKCERVLPLSEFYKHSKMADGHLNKCKECTKKDVHSHYERTLDERKAYEQERGKRPERKAAQRDYSKRRRELHPEAVRASQRAYVEKNLEKVREGQRSSVRLQFAEDQVGYREKRREYARLAKEKDPEAYREKRRQYALRHIEKRRANVAVSNAIRSGQLKKCPCEVCGATRGIHAHHDDYSKPLDVRWLCIKHHHEAHGRVIVTSQDYLTGESMLKKRKKS